VPAALGIGGRKSFSRTDAARFIKCIRSTLRDYVIPEAI
jgi:hypothetical protein